MATLNEKPGEGDFLCVSSCHVGIEESSMAELIAIAKALTILVSKGDVNGSVCVESDSINALAWVVGVVEVPWKIRIMVF
ncbi:hypothetical protein Peur_000927 [Populus x canadensis]